MTDHKDVARNAVHTVKNKISVRMCSLMSLERGCKGTFHASMLLGSYKLGALMYPVPSALGAVPFQPKPALIILSGHDFIKNDLPT